MDEGRAGVFAAMVYPEFESPWLLPEVNQTELRLMKDNLYNTDIEDFMFKDYSYTIGCQIVQSFLENNPDVGIGRMDSNAFRGDTGEERIRLGR